MTKELIYYLIYSIISLSISYTLFNLLKKLINDQIAKEVDVFRKEAKIPKKWTKYIGIKFNWK
tara:strand:- start:191 stop:379 length:189 start_codon:yes stop_codon:yes gene_type:complete